MELTKARAIAQGIVGTLGPYCERIEIAGSIRRGKAEVHDIDIVAIPSNQAFYIALNHFAKVSGGPKIYKIELSVVSQGKAFTADIYIASEATWATLLLIRTGSAQHNIKLCKLAHQKGMKLHSDGTGLFKGGPGPANLGELMALRSGDTSCIEQPIPCATEAGIFAALGLPYKAPGDRE